MLGRRGRRGGLRLGIEGLNAEWMGRDGMGWVGVYGGVLGWGVVVFSVGKCCGRLGLV